MFDRGEIARGVRRAFYLSRISAVSLEGTRALIHRVVLSSSVSFDVFRGAVGGLWVDKGYVPSRRRPAYLGRAIRNLRGHRLDVFFNPSLHRPRLVIEVHPREGGCSRDFLGWLDGVLPGLLKVSSVEYAVDQFCSDPVSASLLYSVERRAFHVPYARRTRDFGDSLRAGRGTRMNRTVHLGGNDRVYERGRDADRVGKGWDYLDLDRVRIEHTAGREELKRQGISYLSDLVRDPHFAAVVVGRWLFRCFEGSPSLPGRYDPYTAADRDGRREMFALEYASRRGRNVRRYLADDLPGLRREIFEAVAAFERGWRGLP